MANNDKELKQIKELILAAFNKARKETSNTPEPELTKAVKWPINCTVGPGLEGGIACETKIGYVNGSKGWLIYRGYDIFDLCANSTYEEVSYLLLHGNLPNATELNNYKEKLISNRSLHKTLRLLMGFPVEHMNAMGSLRLATNLMRHEITYVDQEEARPLASSAIGSDEDSIPMETTPKGEKHAIYEFKHKKKAVKSKQRQQLEDACGINACHHLISGVATLTAAIARIRQGLMPLEPDPELSHAGNFLYMITGNRPTPVEERIMDIALILHADHGMNASTFASMVVASTLSDIYFSVGSGIAALNGPLHGGANEQVIITLNEIGSPENVKPWFEKKLAGKDKVTGFGHRVYKAYDPRARILGPLAKFLVSKSRHGQNLFNTAQTLEKEVIATLGRDKNIFPNVDFYSGIVYSCLGIKPDMFTPIFATSRVSGWTARVFEYLQNNRIFRPRAIYTGEFDKRYSKPAE